MKNKILFVLLQLLVVESSRDQDLHSLYTELADAKALLSKLDEVAHRWKEGNHNCGLAFLQNGPDGIKFMCDVLYLCRYPNQDLEMTKNTWGTNVQEVEKKISTAEVDLTITKMFSHEYVHFPVCICICSATQTRAHIAQY